MALRLAGLATALRAAGLRVVELDGWQDRGQTDGGFNPRAVMWHHDASPVGDSPNVPRWMSDLRNNGAQCWVSRSGVWYLVAAGRMWHAGRGGPWGPISLDDGNTDSVGVETDHTTGEDWPDAQLASLRIGTVVLLRLIGATAAAVLGHKEYRTSNPDPAGLDMVSERQVISWMMNAPEAPAVTDFYNSGDRNMARVTAHRVEALMMGYGHVKGGPNDGEDVPQARYDFDQQHDFRAFLALLPVRRPWPADDQVTADELGTPGQDFPLVTLLKNTRDDVAAIRSELSQVKATLAEILAAVTSAG